MQFLKTQFCVLLCSFLACLSILRILSWLRPSTLSFRGCALDTTFPPLQMTTAQTGKNPSCSQQGTQQAQNTSRLEDEDQKHIATLKNQFLLQVNHELRTPLTAVYCYLDLLKTRQAQLTPAEQEIFVERALKACEDLVGVTNQILQSLEDDFSISHLSVPQADRVVQLQPDRSRLKGV